MNFGNSVRRRAEDMKKGRAAARPFGRWQKISTRLGAGGLEFGVGVRADFAVQIDFFVLRGGPFHE